MRPPSRTLKRFIARATGEMDFLSGIEKDLDLAKKVSEGMDTVFGAALFNALEDLERSAFAGMADTSPWRVLKQIQFRSELRTSRYIKAKLQQYVVNAEALMQNIKMLNEVEDEEA